MHSISILLYNFLVKIIVWAEKRGQFLNKKIMKNIKKKLINKTLCEARSILVFNNNYNDVFV